MTIVNYSNGEEMIDCEAFVFLYTLVFHQGYIPRFEDLFIVYVNDNGEIVITTKDKTNDNMKNLFMNEVAKK